MGYTEVFGGRGLALRYILLIMLLIYSSSACSASSDLPSQTSKLEFQDVQFGDFPSVDMICVRGLYPVGELGVGISLNASVLPAYNQRVAITHYAGVKISTPEFSYFDYKMFMVRFALECSWQGRQECIDMVRARLDAEYGLTPVVIVRNSNHPNSREVEEYQTESGSLIRIDWLKEYKNISYPRVRIIDVNLMNKLKKSLNPDYTPAKIEFLNSSESEN